MRYYVEIIILDMKMKRNYLLNDYEEVLSISFYLLQIPNVVEMEIKMSD